MDLKLYADRIRWAMVESLAKQLEATPDSEILDQDFEVLRSENPTLTREEYDRAVRESMEPGEVDRLLGNEVPDIPGHPAKTATPETARDLDESVFRNLCQSLVPILGLPNASVILCYAFSEDGSMDPSKVHGSSLALGRRDLVDILREEITSQVEASTYDGVVDTSRDRDG